MRFSVQDIINNIPHSIKKPQPLWKDKQRYSDLEKIQRSAPHVFYSQHQQNPDIDSGNLFKDHYWRYYDIRPPRFERVAIFADTAQKTGQQHDYSVFQCWGMCDGQVYLIDQLRGKWEAPQLLINAVDFWNKHKPTTRQPDGCTSFFIEDASSGSSLIQQLRFNHRVPVREINRFKDKWYRANQAVSYIESGYVHLPRNKQWLFDYKNEFREFTATDTHKNDDQIDPTLDAIDQFLIKRTLHYNSRNT